MDRLFQKCLERIDGCVQQVLNDRALTFPAKLPPEFRDVFEKACACKQAAEVANNRRKFNSLTDEEAAREKLTREEFCRAYSALLKKHPSVLDPFIRREVGLA
jgi:uncharacterized protein (DUF2267 family)